MGFYVRVSERLRDRFRHLETEPGASNASDREVTLYAAIKMEIGMGRDESVLAYENHADLLTAIRLVYSTLDHVLSNEIGAASSCQTWALSSDRTEEEVIAVLSVADLLNPQPFEPSLVPLRRPMNSRFLGAGKYRGAIANEACRLVAITGEPFGAVVADALAKSTNDPTFLAALEARRVALAEPGDPRITGVEIGIAFTRTAGKWFDPSRGVTVTDFCDHVSDDWKSMSDEQIIHRLAEMTTVGSL
jgi:hypothetical protein